MAINLNTYPYFDDSEDALNSNFQRILFKPGYAVQARELTQIQSLLQNQIKRFGDNIFKEGSVITGCAESFNFEFPYIKILDSGTNPDLTSYIGKTLKHLSTGVTAVVKQVIDGTSSHATDFKTLYIHYTNSDSATKEISIFVADQVLNVLNADGSTSASNVTVGAGGASPVGVGSLFSVGSGIVYANGTFVLHADQTIVIDRYSSTPSRIVGFRIADSVVTAFDDETLLDPARGSYNYTAPGADRYKMETTLVSYPLDSIGSLDSGFYLLFEVEDGKVKRRFTKTQYAELQRELASRTYDESGNYTVREFPVIINEHLRSSSGTNKGRYTVEQGGDPSKLAVGILPGKAFVRGYEHELFATDVVSIDKAVDTAVLQNQPTSTFYGNYIEVQNVSGEWDFTNHGQLSLLSSSSFVDTIGTATFLNIEYITTNLYRIYLNNIVMNSSETFNDVTHVGIPAGSNISDSKAEIIPADIVLKESSYPSLIFKSPVDNIKTFAPEGNLDTSFIHRVKKTVDFQGTSVEVALTGVDVWASTNFSNDSTILSDLYIVRASTGEVLDFTLASNNTVSLTSPTVITLTLDTPLTGGNKEVTVIGRVRRVNGPPNTKSVKPAFVKLHTTTLFPSGTVTTGSAVIPLSGGIDPVGNINAGDVVYYEVTPGGIFASAGIVSSVSTGQITLTENASVTANGVKIRVDHPGWANGKLSLGISDVFSITNIWATTSLASWPTTVPPTNWRNVTGSFVLNTGQTDISYTNSSISPLSGDFSAQKLIVEVKYFEAAGTSGGYFNIDSYPIPANEEDVPTASEINIWDIPAYPGTTEIFDLRNSIDFRMRMSNTANLLETYSNSTTTLNPANSNTLAVAAVIPVPSEEFDSDIEFYLSRQDRLVLDSAGNFIAIRGIPDASPSLPAPTENSMTIAEVFIPPYPSLSPFMARSLSRPANSVKIRHINNKRYTMRDIGQIEKRLDRIEYYTALSLLETDAAKLLITGPGGEVRFKNGILVDGFTGHNVANVFDPYYRASIDTRARELRPQFNIEQIKLTQKSLGNLIRNRNDVVLVVKHLPGIHFEPGESIITLPGGTVTHAVKIISGTSFDWYRVYLRGITVGSEPTVGNTISVTRDASTISGTIANFIGDADVTQDAFPDALRPAAIVLPVEGELVTLPYDNQTYAENPYATKTRNVVSQLIFTYRGEITLDPSQDTWIDTVELPELQINIDNTNDNWLVSSNDISSPNCAPAPWAADGLSQSGSGISWCRWWDLRNLCLAEVNKLPIVIQPTGIAACNNFRGDVSSPFGTEWGSWETLWTGIDIAMVESQTINPLVGANTWITETITTTTSQQTRTGITVNWIPETRVENLGLKTVNRNVVPFMRSIVVKFNAVRLKPETRIYPFFDGVAVDVHCRPLGGSYGDSLITNARGEFSGEFRIPSGQFTVGSKAFELVDRADRVASLVRSIAAEVFTSSGTMVETQNTIRSTRTARPTLDVIEETRNAMVSRQVDIEITRTGAFGGEDPTAQTFFITGREGGVFITKLDLYFRTRSSTAPITVQIRETVNGYPGARIVPFGSVTLQPSDVNISDAGDAVTEFAFPSPVFLENNTEYCFVILPAGNNDEYNLWVSELGEDEVGTGTRVSEQPYAGVLFVSANNRAWTALQTEDIKFTLYEAAFNTGVIGTLTLRNEPIDYLFVPGTTQFSAGEVVTSKSASGTASGVVQTVDRAASVARVLVTSGQFITSPNLTGTVSNPVNSSVITGAGTDFTNEVIVGSLLTITQGLTDVPIGIVQSVDSAIQLTLEAQYAPEIVAGTTIKIQHAVVKNQSGTVKLPLVDIEQKNFSVFAPTLAHLNFTGTNVSWAYSTNQGTNTTNFTPVNTTDTRRALSVKSKSNEIGDNESLTVRALVSSTQENLSPVLDLKKMGVLVIGNTINSSTLDEENNDGAALARYITRKVVLDLDDAENIKVYLDADKPAGTGITVYGKLSNSTDPTPFEDLQWIELEENAPRNSNGFAEYSYELGSDNLVNDVFEYTNSAGTFSTFKTFAIKIVMTSTSVAVVPRIKDLRVIAVS